MTRADQLIEDWQRITQNNGRVVLANSLGLEDMVLLDSAAKADIALSVLVLETGRLHNETLDLLALATQRYAQFDWIVQTPDPQAVQHYAQSYGMDGFRDSVEARKACCGVRKVAPLGRALSHFDAWVTGQRQQQSSTRAELAFQEVDKGHDMLKFNPLAEWTLAEIRAYIEHTNTPYNPLHDQHYPSIGCQPCTRAIAAGEDVRAGRWWWENPETKECGLHPIR